MEKKLEIFLNGVKEFCKLCLIGFFVSFIVVGVPGFIMLSWGDEENIERCMQEFPERTYDECESAVAW